MKRLFLLLLLFIATAALGAPQISPSQLKPFDGFVRKSPCQAGAGDNCGKNASWHITPDQCGFVFSTSSARDEQYTYARESGTGIATVFNIPFRYLSTSDLVVKVGGVTQTLGVDFTASAALAASGTMTFTTPPALGATVDVSVKKTYNGDGVTTAFQSRWPADFVHAVVVKVGGVTKAYNTDYTITSGLGSNGAFTVTFGVAPAVGVDNVSIEPLSTGTSRGNRFTFPTIAELTAAGYQPGSASPNENRTNREGQCTLSFVVAAPAPANYLRIAMPADAVRLTDKFTMIEGGASFDASSGDLIVPHGWGTIRWRFNGVSWLYDGNSNFGDRLGTSSPHTNGQGRLFLVTADPSWWSVTSRINTLAWCPVGGRGIAANANDHPTLLLSALNCSYLDPSGSSTDYVVAKSINGLNLSGISQGAAYIAGQAPNGKFYPAGNYVKVSLSGTDGGALVTGDTLTVWNAPSTLGTVATGKWIIQVTSKTLKCDGITAGACVELHEEIWDWDATVSGKNGVGPPSFFVAGDTLSDADGTNRPCCTAIGLLTASTASGRISEPVNGIDLQAGLQESPVVGLAKQVASVWTSSGSKQNVAGVYNPVERRCTFSPSADKNIVSLTDVEVDNTTNCEFAYLNGTSKAAMDRGDQGRRVRYQVSATVSSNTAANGCQLNIIFDAGTAEETASPIFVNPAGVTGGKFNISFAGNKSGLTEGVHTAKLVAKAITGGTCTIYSAGTTTSIWILQ